MFRNYCITSDETTDRFVGIRFVKNGQGQARPEVVFPHGYNIGGSDAECRKDVFRLLGTLQTFAKQKNGKQNIGTEKIVSTMPLQSFQYLIMDYLQHGYYYEKESYFIEDNKGRISWKRTIHQEKPVVAPNGIIYLKYQVKTSRINENRLITRIHQYCVYQSFLMFGWLYLPEDHLPPKPTIALNKPLFLSVLRDALANTFNDTKKKLFQSMINVINFNPEDITYNGVAIGVDYFESVWERLIDYVFGEDDKERYFPRAQWHIFKDGRFVESSALEPDTVMKYKDKIYILDAKYYRYGITGNVDHLPATSSIQKQITYGKHAVTVDGIPPDKVYNAFVLPYNCKGNPYVLDFVAVGTGMWEKEQSYNYQYVLGLLLDTKHLITTFAKHNLMEIENLANKIEESLESYKQAITQSLKN